MFGLLNRGIDHYERELSSSQSQKRQKAAQNLWKVKDPRALELLAGALQDTESQVRESAAHALGFLQDSSAAPSLVRALEDMESGVRLAAASSLMELGDPRGGDILFASVESLLRTLNDPLIQDPNDTVALGILGETNYGMELLVHALKENPDNELRQFAALVLACDDDPLSNEALTHAHRQDPSEEVRRVAAVALAIRDGDEEAFCLKCRANRSIKNRQRVTLINGRPARIGVCPDCGTRVFQVGKT